MSAQRSNSAALLARSRQQRLAQLQQVSSSPPSLNLGLDMNFDMNFTPNPFAPTPGPSSFNTFAPPLSVNLKSFGERALKRVKLSHIAEAEFRQYLESTTEERAAMSFLHTLRAEDLLMSASEQRITTWTPPNSVMKIIRKYTRAAILLPNIQYYSGAVEAIVIRAMRADNVQGLPSDDSLESDALRSQVGIQVTHARNDLKTVIKKSLATGGTSNLANVMTAVLKLCKTLQPTLALYHRLAFIRMHFKENHPERKFWGEVDDGLDVLRAADAKEFLDAMQTCYNEDKSAHGDPATVEGFFLGAGITPESPKWLRTLNDLVPHVQRVTQGIKRPRNERDDEEDGDEDEQSGNGDVGNVNGGD